MKIKQFVVTPAMGKRLIAKALVQHPVIRAVLGAGRLVIVAGTTNGYVAEEVLGAVGQVEGFVRKGFRRGLTVPPEIDSRRTKADFPGDVVLVDGVWQPGRTIFDAAAELHAGDVIVKGANAVNLAARQAAVLIGHPEAGTIGVALQVAAGRRVRLILPVGLEKRVDGDLTAIANALNSPDADGPRLLPVPGELFTELDAIRLATGAEAFLAAGGGVYGAEGAVWLAVRGEEGQVEAAEKWIDSVKSEPPCEG